MTEQTEQKEFEPEMMSFPITSKQTEKLITKTDGFLEQLDRVIITNDESMENATDLVKFIKVARKQADEVRTSLVKPLNEQVKKINAEWQPRIKKANEAVKVIEDRMTVFIRVKRQKEREAQQKLIKEQEAAALAEAEKIEKDEKLSEPEKEEKTEQVMDQAIQQTSAVQGQKPSAPVYGNYGSTASTRKSLDFEVSEKTKVAEKYHVINSALLRVDIMAVYRDAKSSGEAQKLKGEPLAAHCIKILTAAFPGVVFEFKEKVNVR